MKVRIKEARSHYKKVTGQKLTQYQLAEEVMKDHNGSIQSKVDLLNRMQKGQIDHPRAELLARIATLCWVDYNFLLCEKNFDK